jgi:hypothetical protein
MDMPKGVVFARKHLHLPKEFHLEKASENWMPP